ncbi:MAG: flagellar basal body-associated FliL family protein [Pseudomonadota bacterium]
MGGPLWFGMGSGMAEETENEEAGDGEEGEDGEAPKKKKLSGKVLVLFIALPLLLIGGGVGAAFMLGVFGGSADEEVQLAEGETAPEPEEDLPPPTFVPLPEIIVNLSNGGEGRAIYLKLRVKLEVRDPDANAVLDPIMPRVVDRFQVFLRQLRVSDLEGSAGMLRLKQELLRRINLAAAPLKVEDVLFEEMIIQ